MTTSEGPASPSREAGPPETQHATTAKDSRCDGNPNDRRSGVGAQLRRRRTASRRLSALDCGHHDPLDHTANPHRGAGFAAYRAAWLHLAALGLIDVVPAYMWPEAS